MPGQAGLLYGTLGAPAGPLGASIGADRRDDTQCLLATGDPLEAIGAVGPGQVVVDEAHVGTPEVVVALHGATKQKVVGALRSWRGPLTHCKRRRFPAASHPCVLRISARTAISVPPERR
jgi:hypothetical protein